MSEQKMDAKLIESYANAVRVRHVLEFLPEGLREWSLQYEAACLADLRKQAGKPSLTQEEILAQAKPLIWTIIKTVWPLIKPLIIEMLKKRWPTIAVSGTVGGLSIAGIVAAISAYLTK